MCVTALLCPEMTASLKLSVASSPYTLSAPSSQGSLSLGEKGVLDHLLEMLTDPPKYPLLLVAQGVPTLSLHKSPILTPNSVPLLLQAL